MTEADKDQNAHSDETVSPSSSNPLVFISHDSRDADLAEAFSKLLRSVSAGMIKTFRSSDKKGTEGIDFGEEWYKRLMSKLQTTSDVICLFTERSIDRPWILFEAGVAKSKMSTPVVGIALGVPLARVSTGPFYQFQNMDDSKVDLTKLIRQLARRVPGLELDDDVVSSQVATFKATEAEILKALSSNGDGSDTNEESENPISKLVEEMKSLPSRVAESLSDTREPMHSYQSREIHPMMLQEMMHMAGTPDNPVAILVFASMFRDDAPWLYELTMEMYRAVKTGHPDFIKREIKHFRQLTELMMRTPFAKELGFTKKYINYFCMDFPMLLEPICDKLTREYIQPIPKIPKSKGQKSINIP